MRFGICTTPDNIDVLAPAGFDYAELSLNTIAALDPDAYESLRRQVGTSPIKVESFNGFFPWSMRVVGPNANPEAIRSYAESAMERAAGLGGKVVVVGNGGSRRIPEGYEKSSIIAQFAGVLRVIGDEAAKYGIIAALEPLNVRETDFINSIPEGVELVRAADHPHVRLLADFYHIRMDDEPMENLAQAKGMLAHVHIANAHGRIFPADAGEDLYEEFFCMLHLIGYDERVSLEAASKDLALEAPLALAVLKEVASRGTAAQTN